MRILLISFQLLTVRLVSWCLLTEVDIELGHLCPFLHISEVSLSCVQFVLLCVTELIPV